MRGKVVLITGGTKAIALCFAAKGAGVFLNYSSDEESAKRAVSEVRKAGGSCQSVKADVSDGSRVEEMFGYVLGEAGRLDVLINNAGIIRDGLLMMMPEKNWRRVMEINLDGVYHCSKAALRPMIENRWGRIVNVISPSAIMGRQGQCNYAASKGGVLSFTRSLAREVARFGITVNALSPGVIETELTAGLDDSVREEFLRMIPIGRLGRPGEVAHAALYLASEESGYVTGEILAVDGGIT